MNQPVQNPHARFFREAMSSSLQVAKDFLRAHLSPNIVKEINWDTLKLTNKSYVEEKRKHLASDMVYSYLIDGEQAYIYLLLEYPEEPDPLLSFWVLAYNVMLQDEHIKQGNEHLPLVSNLVLYLGKKTPYPFSLDIYDCFEAPDIAREMMFKSLATTDVGQWPRLQSKRGKEEQS